jgi:hypothetical protein
MSWYMDSSRKMPVNSTTGATVVCKPRGTFVPLFPPSYSNNHFKPHVSLNTHSSRGPFTDAHLELCATNHSSAGSHSYANDTEARNTPPLLGSPDDADPYFCVAIPVRALATSF